MEFKCKITSADYSEYTRNIRIICICLRIIVIYKYNKKQMVTKSLISNTLKDIQCKDCKNELKCFHLSYNKRTRKIFNTF